MPNFMLVSPNERFWQKITLSCSTMGVKQRDTSLPDGLLKKAGLATSLAWDNYDENTETLSGSGTLHDTVGICYQNVQDVGVNGMESLTAKTLSEALVGKRTRKQTLDVDGTEKSLEPYRKKPRISSFSYAIKCCGDSPASLLPARRRDQLWSYLCYQFNDTPMWVGWNSTVTVDSLPQQHVAYMENLSLPPTRLDVVTHTQDFSKRGSRV